MPQGGLSYKPVASQLKELDLSGLKQGDIQILFKVPDPILGSLEGTEGKEDKDALTAFWPTA
ncbi:hypothetical protein GSbR_27870 [Geobacter sp. SVR]|nr:hypothetical protein GSVR_23400 [Geobacter sp. SVR]GCF86187.1 hypothetical protein GSbR_27870 [Geobacter sp. SVR]